MEMNAAQPMLLASEYTTFLHKLGFSTIERQFKFLTERSQNWSSFIESESKVRTESQVSAQLIRRCKALVINLQMLPRTIEVELINPVTEASCLALILRDASASLIEVSNLTIFFCGMDKVWNCKFQSRPNQVNCWLGHQIDFSSFGTRPLFIRSD